MSEYPFIQFGKLIISDNAGEVIPKEFWNEGNEVLYTCQKTPMSSNYASFEDRRRTAKGDMLLTRNGTPYIFIPEVNSIYSNVVQRVKINHEKADLYFLRYALENSALSMLGNGDIIASFNMGIWKRLSLSLPDFATQQRIAAFLDERTGKIDSLVEEFAKFKANLLLQKRSLVSECVTKGLPSERDRVCKDSGVEWLGEVPVSWSIKKVKHVMAVQFGQSPEGDSINLDGDGILFMQGATEFGLIYAEPFKFTSDAKKTVEANTILMSVRAPVGSINISNQKIAIGRGLAGILPVKNVSDFKYVQYLLIAARKAFDEISSGTTFEAINQQQFNNIKMPIPPLDEQKRIADYLDSECDKIDALIGEIGNQVNLLKTYRKSLINEAVTGKIEI